jgi:hypothetical protein
VETAGFRWAGEQSVGLEDFRPFRHLPTELFLGLARAFGDAGVLPHHFVLLRKAGESPPRLPPIEEVVTCPDCGARLPRIGKVEFDALRCSGCGRGIPMMGGVADLRPFPESVAPSDAPILHVRAP